MGGTAAVFETSGGTVQVRISDMDLGPLFDQKPGKSAAYVGPSSSPPTYDERSSKVSNATHELDLVEDEYASVELDAGTYWLWTSNSGTISVRGCRGNEVTEG